MLSNGNVNIALVVSIILEESKATYQTMICLKKVQKLPNTLLTKLKLPPREKTKNVNSPGLVQKVPSILQQLSGEEAGSFHAMIRMSLKNFEGQISNDFKHFVNPLGFSLYFFLC